MGYTGGPYVKIAGDPKFVSERLIGYEAGYRTLVRKRRYLDLAGFYNNYDDLESYGTPTIEFATTPPPTRILVTVPWSNGIKGTTSGGEIVPEWEVTSGWKLRGSYSYLQMELQDRPGYTDTGTFAADEGSSPQHEVSVQSLVNLPRGIEIDETYRYVSALPALLINAYGTADARLGWQPDKHFEISVAGQNLLQPFHMESSADPGPLVGIKRSVYAQITWRR